MKPAFLFLALLLTFEAIASTSVSGSTDDAIAMDTVSTDPLDEANKTTLAISDFWTDVYLSGDCDDAAPVSTSYSTGLEISPALSVQSPDLRGLALKPRWVSPGHYVHA